MAVLATFMTPLKSDINETLKLWFETHKKWLNSAKNLLRVGQQHISLLLGKTFVMENSLGSMKEWVGPDWDQTQPLTGCLTKTR